MKRFLLRWLDAILVTEATAAATAAALDGYERAFRKGARFGWELAARGQTPAERDAVVDEVMAFAIGLRPAEDDSR